MQHFLQPRFLRNMLRKKYLLTAFLNLPVEEEVSIKAKYSAYYLNNVSKPGKLLLLLCVFKKKRVPQQRSKCMTYGTEIPVDFLMTNICLLLESRAMSGNRKCIKKMSINKRTFVGLNH